MKHYLDDYGITAGEHARRVKAAKRKRQQELKAKRMREVSVGLKAAGLTHHAGRRGTKVEADWKRQMEHVPDDTRDLTAVVFGDPLPGRSALDKRGPFISALGR